MSADEKRHLTAADIIASLKVEADVDLVAQLDKQLGQAVPAQSEEKKCVKFVFVGDGNYIVVSGIYSLLGVQVAIELGRATSLKKGSGVLWTTYVAHGVSGGYKLELGARAAKLYEGGEQIWFWKGEVEGLQGAVDIVFDCKAVASFANLVFPV